MISTKHSNLLGMNIIAKIGEEKLADLQTISWSIMREQAPIYTMGQDTTPQEFARGKRTIAGSLVFSQNIIDLGDLIEVGVYELAPLDIEITSADGYVMKILGVKLVEFVNVNDIVSEHDYTFIAQHIFKWQHNSDIHAGPIGDDDLRPEEYEDCPVSNKIAKSLTYEDFDIENEHRGMIYNPLTNTWSWL